MRTFRPSPREPAALSDLPAYPQPTDRRQRILIIEDNRDAADLLQLMLEMLGHEVAVAYSGPDGVRLAQEWRPQVVLSDIGLPGGLDGWGVAQTLRADPATAGARLIAITGYGREEDRRHSREVGFEHHLVKPVDPEVLEGLLRRP